MSGQYYDNDDTKIRGNSDDSLIGNVGDRLKVDVGAGEINVVSQDSAQHYCETNRLYSIGLDVSMATSGNDNPLVLFRNPSGSGKTIFLWRIHCGSTVTNVAAEFKVWATPTVTTNGTSQTPVARHLNNSQPAAVALVNTLPTISSLGSPLSFLSTGQNSNAVIFADEFSIALEPNSAVLLTGAPTSNNRNTSITITWAEI